LIAQMTGQSRAQTKFRSGTRQEKKAAKVKAYATLKAMREKIADDVWLSIFGKQRRLKPQYQAKFDALTRHSKRKRRTAAKGNQ
jgi:hypothetical protein